MLGPGGSLAKWAGDDDSDGEGDNAFDEQDLKDDPIYNLDMQVRIDSAPSYDVNADRVSHDSLTCLRSSGRLTRATSHISGHSQNSTSTRKRRPCCPMFCPLHENGTFGLQQSTLIHFTTCRRREHKRQDFPIERAAQLNRHPSYQ